MPPCELPSHTAARRCLRRYKGFGASIAFEGHGWPVGFWPRTRTAEECARRCANLSSCMFYSHDSEMRCYLCASCELRRPASRWSEERRFDWIVQVHRFLRQNQSRSVLRALRAPSLQPVVASSWARTLSPFVRAGAIPEAVRQLRAWLDTPEYTTAVYGEGGVVPPTSQLRVVWLSLLPKQALRQIAKVGICARVSPVPPLQPFFANIGIRENPTNAMWIAQPIPRPAPSHSW